MEHLAKKIACDWNKKLQLSETDFLKMQYGLELICINTVKSIIIFSIAFFVGVGWDTLIICVAFAALRSCTFGEHLESSVLCTIISCVTHVGLPYLFMSYQLGKPVFVFMSVLLVFLIYCYAPADTEKHPVLGAEHRKKLKKDAVITAAVLTLLALVIPYSRLTLLVLLSEVYIVIAILPITYKILGRKRNNYEKYE